MSESEQDLSSELGAEFTPHYRSESVECHPADNTWSARLNRLAAEQAEHHSKTYSEDFQNAPKQVQSRPNHSVDLGSVPPPPGFSKPFC